jgi:TolA-binding protein
MVNRFGGPLVHEGRFGVARAREQMKQYEQAIVAYEQVARGAGGELAARAQFRAGACRLAQGRPAEAVKAFLAVASGYDYPEWTAAALCEAARAYAESGQADEARKTLDRVVADNPQGEWNDLAKRRLDELK